MKKWLKIFLIVVGVFIGMILLVNVLAGPVVKAYAEKHSEELCHRKATIKHVRINLFTGKVVVEGFDVKEENGKDRFFYFDKLKVRVSLWRMLGKTVRINKILLDGLDAHVVQDGIQFNFSDIIDFYTKDKNKKPDKEPSQWKVDIRNIELHNCAVLYEDVRMGSRFDTRHVSAKVPRLDLEGGPSHIDLVTDFKDGSGFNLDGDYNIKKGDFDAHVKMHKLSLDLALPYLKKLTTWGELSGILNGDAKVNGNVKHIEDMVFSGTMAMNNVKATNSDKSPLASFSAFEVNMDKMDLGKMKFEVSKVLLKDPVFHFDVYEDGTTLSRLQKQNPQADSSIVAPPRADTAQKQTVKPSVIQYLLKNLAVSNGKIVYTDHAIEPQTQQFTVSGINIQAENLSNDQKSPITLNAKLGSSGELDCKAWVNPFDIQDAETEISIKNLNIKDFTPYSLYYLAYPVEDGLLAFNSAITIKDNMLDSQNNLDIYKPTFGKKDKSITPAAAKIPMQTAMYLITDRKGHVKMELPVQGDVSSPEFSFRKVIWKTFLNLVVKIAASPVDFIAKVAGGDNTFKPMFVPVDNPAELDIENTHQLNALAEWLKEKDKVSMMVSISPPAESELSEEAAIDVVQKCFQAIRNQLAKQGVASDRVTLTDERKDHKSKGNLKVEFDVNYAE